MRKEDRTGSQVHKSVFLHLMIAACNVIYPQFFFSTRDNQLIDVMYKTLLDPNSIDGDVLETGMNSSQENLPETGSSNILLRFQ